MVYRILVYDIPSILIFLDVWHYFKIKKDKLNTYEKQNNAPYMLSISTCVLIYPALMWLIISMSMITDFFVFLLLITCLSGWIPGLVFFIKDQIRLYQFKKNYPYNKSFWIRIIGFLILYPFFTYTGYAMLGMLF